MALAIIFVSALVFAGIKLAPRVLYSLAEKDFEVGDYGAAAAKFESAGNYNDAEERFAEASELAELCEHYNNGISALNAKEYGTAFEELKQAEDFSDAPEQLKEATYLLADEEEETGQYERAAEHFKSILGFKNADDRAEYSSAMLAYQNKKYEDAAKLFDASNNVVEDAEEKSRECKYLYAEEQFAKCSYETARTYYLKIPGYKDSREKEYACSLMLGIQDIRNGYLFKAKSVLESLPEDFEYNGQSVKAQLDLLSEHSEFVDICGEWAASGTCTVKVTQTHTRTGIWHNWTSELQSPSFYKLSILCPISADGNVSLLGSVTFDRFTNYSSISEYLESADKTVSFTRAVTGMPYQLDIGNHTTLTYSNGAFLVSYSETINNQDIYFDYTYESEFTYGNHETSF